MTNQLKTCIIIPFYQDVDALRTNLPKHYDFVDMVILADGPFPDFPVQLSRSEDGSREFIREYVRREKAVLIDAGRGYMMAKLNLLFDKAYEMGYDLAILLGCDHYLTGNMEELKQNVAVKTNISKPAVISFFYREHQPNSSKWNANEDGKWHSLGFLHPERIRVRHTHYMYFIDNAKKFANAIRVEGITVHHDDSVRPKKRNRMMEKYQAVNVPREDRARNKAFDEMPI